jgi:hypothetical protein
MKIFFIFLAGDVRSKIEKLKKELKDIIDPDTVLLSVLKTRNVLTTEESNDILQFDSVERKNDKLIEILLSKNVTEAENIMAAFKQAGQEHVVNYITSEGGNVKLFTVVHNRLRSHFSRSW